MNLIHHDGRDDISARSVFPFLDMLLKEPRLQSVRAQIQDAGCEILPESADGAIVLAPLPEQQTLEAGVQLRAHHINVYVCE